MTLDPLLSSILESLGRPYGAPEDFFPLLPFGNPFQAAQKKRNANALVQAALRAGALVRPSVCSECGQCRGRIEGHHDDYDEPLRVRWLCSACHSKANLARRHINGHRWPDSYDFAIYLLINGGLELPPRCDPPIQLLNGYSCEISRSILRIDFKGLDPHNQHPLVDFTLSCGHVKTSYASELSNLPTIQSCHPCESVEEQTLIQRAARRNERRRKATRTL